MKNLLKTIFLFLILVKSFAQTTPPPCNPTGKVAASIAMEVYLGTALCTLAETFKNDDGSFSPQNAERVIEGLKNAISSNPAFAGVVVNFPASNAAILAALAAGNCQQAAQTLASGFSGDISTDKYNTDILGAYPDIFKTLLPKELKLTAETNPPSCGLGNGKITLRATEGTAPYQYSIDAGKTWQQSNDRTKAFENLGAGEYECIVRDNNGAEAKKKVKIIAEGTPAIIASNPILATAPTSAYARIAATTSDGIISFNVRFNDKKETKICLKGVIGEYKNGVLTITGFTDNNPLNEQWKGKYYPTFNKNNPDIFNNFYKKDYYDKSLPCQQVICTVEKEGEAPQNMCREAILPNSFYHDNCDITPKIYVSARLINLVNKIKEQNSETKTENGRTLKIFASDYRMSSANLQKIADEFKNLPNDHLAIWLHELENGNVKYEVFTGPNVVYDAEREKIIDAWLLALDPYIPDMPFNPFYAVLNGVSEMAKQHLTFPKKYWDCDDKDYTQLPWVSDAADCVDECITTEDWAFLCGVWDGAINEVTGIVDFFTILSDGQKRSELKQSLISLKNSETWAAMWQNLKTQHTEASGCQLSYQIGKDVVAVGSLVLPITKLSRAKMIATAGNLADNVVLTLARFKNVASGAYRVANNVSIGVINITRVSGKIVTDIADNLVWAAGETVNLFGNSWVLQTTDGINFSVKLGDRVLAASQIAQDAGGRIIATIKDGADEVMVVIKGSYRTLDDIWRLHPNLKAYFDDLPASAQSNLEQFTPNSLKKALDRLRANPELTTALKQNPEISKLWTAHHGTFTPDELAQARELFGELGNELSTDARNLAEDLAEESGEKAKMLEIFGLGRQLNTNILNSIRSKSGRLFDELADKLGMTAEELKLYEVLDEIPLNTSGGFMKADIMLIKRNAAGTGITDAIIIENKLSTGTALTVRQKEGFGTIINGQTSMNVNYDVTKYGLSKNDIIPVSNQKIFKMYDHGTDDISKVSIQKITSTN